MFRTRKPLIDDLHSPNYEVVIGVDLWNRVYTPSEDNPNPDAADLSTILLSWFALVGIATCFASLACATRGQGVVEFGGRRKGIFMMLTTANFCDLVGMFFLFLTHVA
jgi:hypothetical protein